MSLTNQFIPRSAYGACFLRLLCTIWLAQFITGCSQPRDLRLDGHTMGTTWSASLVSVPAAIDEADLKQGVQGTVDEINDLMTTWRQDSELSQFNQLAAGQWFFVSGHTWRVIREGVEVYQLSGGAFDMTVLPLVNLWGFGPAQRPDHIPDAAAIERARDELGMNALIVSDGPPHRIRKTKSIHLDLSAIAKGYAVDQVATFLESRGIENFLVEIGGEVRVSGRSPRGGNWRVAIEAPLVDRRQIFDAIELSDAGIATSGDYRNYYEEDGVRYSHTIDPTSGYPVNHTLASVTVIANSAVRADALATALNVLGPEKGAELAEQQQIAALFLVKTADGFEQRASSSFHAWVSTRTE